MRIPPKSVTPARYVVTMKATTITRERMGMLMGITWTRRPESRLSDDELVELFANAGLGVDLVAHCDDVSCPVCFAALPAKAA